MTLSCFCRVALLAFCCIAPVWAQDSVIGFVKTVQGDAWVLSAEHSTPALLGAALRQSDRLKTGAQGSLGVSLKDNTLLSIGPDTELLLQDYSYDPVQESLQLAVRLIVGTLNYVSGSIAKLKPTGVKVHTPSGTIGVRGTHFTVKVAPAE